MIEMSINEFLITKKWLCDMCTHHLNFHSGGSSKKECTECPPKDCKEFFVEAKTEFNYLIRSKLIDKWYFFYEHGYLLRYHWKPTDIWENEFIRYNDFLIKQNQKPR